MHTKTRKMLHPIRYLRGNSHRQHKHSLNLAHQISGKIKRNPYQTAGVILGVGLGVLSGLYIVYHYKK